MLFFQDQYKKSYNSLFIIILITNFNGIKRALLPNQKIEESNRHIVSHTQMKISSENIIRNIIL